MFMNGANLHKKKRFQDLIRIKKTKVPLYVAKVPLYERKVPLYADQPLPHFLAP